MGVQHGYRGEDLGERDQLAEKTLVMLSHNDWRGWCRR